MKTPPQPRRELIKSCEKLRIEFPEELPISRHVDEIKEAWRSNQVIIVAGDTGSGKTTQLPKIALALGYGRTGRIGCTQPRRLAATAMARRAARELGCDTGNEVGYQVRFDDRTQRSTVLKFMTDGILLAETRNDRNLKQYEVLIIDEAHERSLNIDFILGYLKNLLPYRPDLKIAISSATLDVESFAEFFHAPVLSIEGRTFPVEDLYLPPGEDEDLSGAIGRAVEFAGELDPRGDILVFLPGEREIRDATDLLTGRNYRNTEVLPLYGRLAAADQQKVFNPGNMRRIILATNVAETSVTIPRIRFVVDSGLARIKRFNPRSRIEELHIETISQASARQRRGRCGRIADGVCIHLYSEDDLRRSAPFTDPEIKRTGLAGVILQMASLRLPRIDRFPFINPPPPAAVREGLRTLEDLRALDPAGRLTREGWKLAALPIDPHLGKMLSFAEARRVLPELLVITAFLSIQDPQERPLEKQQAADEAHRRFRDPKSDFLSILNLWNAVVRECGSNRQMRLFCRKNFYNFNRMLEWRNLVSDLAESAAELKWSHAELPKEIENTPYDTLHESILAGIPRNIAHYVPEEQYFLGTGGRKFLIFPGSGLAKKKPVPAWLLSFALVETSRLFARQNAEIKPEYLEVAAPHLCSKIYDQPKWDSISGFVYARERLTFGGLLIHNGRRVHYAKSHPAEAREVFIREALATGELNLPGTWVEKHVEVLRSLERMEEKLRRPGTVLDPGAVADHYLLLLPQEINSTRSLKESIKHDPQDYSISRADAMQEQFISWREEDYPDALTFSGQKFKVVYRFAPGEPDDGISLVSPSDRMNLLPGWALDYLVPGWLGEKTELLIRSLPKPIRQKASPIAETVDRFLEALDAGQIFREQPLVDALAEFLRETTGEPVAPGDFDDSRLPAYLRMKLLEVDANGRAVKLHESLPESFRHGSRLSAAVTAAGKLTVRPGDSWPGVEPLPREIELPNANGKTAFPALCDEDGKVGRAVFLKESEAKLNHRRGLLRLFKLENANQLKFLKRTARVSREVDLSWFLNYRDWADDLLDAAILEAFGEEPWEIRDELTFGIAAERAKQETGEAETRLLKQLETLYPVYRQVRDLMDKCKSRAGTSCTDLKRQLNFLFRPRFLRSPAVFERYSRYLRGAKLRAERIASAPARDEAKLETIEAYLDRFYLAADSVEEITDKPELETFWLLTEECRLAVFAPEISPAIRAPLKKLEPAWEELRF
ncbi:ATP-dependent RNA helicase HrpA [uncultured Victivallis sp.]|uniref:ATP-dependent RNA helicase HrpA n=1 Tax=uncultured Victivallis sp. TaxID=354118 RepID=UPI0025F57423|nr:ATP-dependent RNA helicase HrpA [uncultured Victivallis sp.]